MRITAQLVRAATDQHIWAESYERDLRDLVALQDEGSRTIATQIQKQTAQPVPQQLAISAVVTPQARESYLKGRYFWNLPSEAGYLKAIDYFQSAVADDPIFRSGPPFARLKSLLPVSAADEISNRCVGLRQRLLVRQKDNSKMVGSGLLTEAGAVHHHDVLLQNKFLHKHIIAFGNIDAGIGVERAAGRDATYPRRRVAPLDRQIASAAKLFSDFDQVIL